jgi:hypothetical protein
LPEFHPFFLELLSTGSEVFDPLYVLRFEIFATLSVAKVDSLVRIHGFAKLVTALDAMGFHV